jgi:hypothetical protein
VFASAVAGLRQVAPATAPPVTLAGVPAGTVLARGEAGSEDAGTWVTFAARVRDGRVARLDARVFGCPHTRAACDRAVQLLTGAPVAQLGLLEPLSLGAGLGIPQEKAGRLLIIQDALRNCLADWDNGELKPAP